MPKRTPNPNDAINMYIVVLCKSDNMVTAIQEAHEIAERHGDIVELHQCGTQKLLCHVAPSGSVSLPKG